MSTIQTIAVLLLGSALLQGLAFYIYSNFYKKKHLNLQLNHGKTADDNNEVDFSKFMLPAAHQPSGKKTGLDYRSNRPFQNRISVSALQPNAPVISISSKAQSIKQKVKKV